MRLLRAFLRLCAVVGIATLIGSYLGALHPLGDSLAVFRLWIAGGVALCGFALLVLRARAAAILCFFPALLAGMTPTSNLLLPNDQAIDEASETYSFYQRNLLFLARQPQAIVTEVSAREPDFVTLQEVARSNRAQIFDRLPEEYERAYCPFSGVGGVAIAPRFDLLEDTILCVEGLGMIAGQVDTPDGPVWLVSIHLHWPWPFGQAAQVDQILPLLARMDGPILIGGDFNMVRWSHVLREFEHSSGSAMAHQGLNTFFMSYRGYRGPGFEIDHILLPARGPVTVERLGFLGSDHRGLLARFSL